MVHAGSCKYTTTHIFIQCCVVCTSTCTSALHSLVHISYAIAVYVYLRTVYHAMLESIVIVYGSECATLIFVTSTPDTCAHLALMRLLSSPTTLGEKDRMVRRPRARGMIRVVVSMSS